jgi:hypothetical protein
VEETLNIAAEADRLCNALRYERASLPGRDGGNTGIAHAQTQLHD